MPSQTGYIHVKLRSQCDEIQNRFGMKWEVKWAHIFILFHQSFSITPEYHLHLELNDGVCPKIYSPESFSGWFLIKSLFLSFPCQNFLRQQLCLST